MSTKTIDKNDLPVEVFSHDEFLLRLSNLGLTISIKSFDSSSSQYNLLLNSILVSREKYEIFGYLSSGTYNTCSRSNQTEFTQKDIDNAIKETISILSEEISDISRVPNYFTCKDYLNKHFGKTKVEKDAINRVFKLIKDNYNDIIRSVSVS
jgi:hypothetical protein